MFMKTVFRSAFLVATFSVCTNLVAQSIITPQPLLNQSSGAIAGGSIHGYTILLDDGPGHVAYGTDLAESTVNIDITDLADYPNVSHLHGGFFARASRNTSASSWTGLAAEFSFENDCKSNLNFNAQHEAGVRSSGPSCSSWESFWIGGDYNGDVGVLILFGTIELKCGKGGILTGEAGASFGYTTAFNNYAYSVEAFVSPGGDQLFNVRIWPNSAPSLNLTFYELVPPRRGVYSAGVSSSTFADTHVSWLQNLPYVDENTAKLRGMALHMVDPPSPALPTPLPLPAPPFIYPVPGLITNSPDLIHYVTAIPPGNLNTFDMFSIPEDCQ
jgi:hypothetical protein